MMREREGELVERGKNLTTYNQYPMRSPDQVRVRGKV